METRDKIYKTTFILNVYIKKYNYLKKKSMKNVICAY